jgi:hypothetical protein
MFAYSEPSPCSFTDKGTQKHQPATSSHNQPTLHNKQPPTTHDYLHKQNRLRRQRASSARSQRPADAYSAKRPTARGQRLQHITNANIAKRPTARGQRLQHITNANIAKRPTARGQQLQHTTSANNDREPTAGEAYGRHRIYTSHTNIANERPPTWSQPIHPTKTNKG